MLVLWIWAGIILTGLLGYFLVLRIHQKQRPFRIKLTLLFLLFVLIPTVPLTLLNVRLLTQSARVILLPGLDQAMHQALETIRMQSEERGRLFFKVFPDDQAWSFESLQKFKIDYAAVYDNNRLGIPQKSFDVSGSFHSEFLNSKAIQSAFEQNATSKLIEHDSQSCLLVFEFLKDSSFYVVGYKLNDSVGLAKRQLSQTINMYNTMSLLQETILRKNLVMVLAFILLTTLVLLSVVVAGRISKTVNEPVDVLVKGMERVKRGNLDDSIVVKSKGEFGFLTESFNQMIADLKESHEKLIVSEKLAAWREVARRMSHEIKNSLTPITLSLRQIRERLGQSQDDEETRQSIHILEDEFNHLKSLAETFSTFAKMPKPLMAEMSLNDTIKHVVQLNESLYPQIRFDIDLDENLPFISGDYEQLKRVFVNLIQNGADAIKSDGELMIKTEWVKGSEYQVRCEIKDTGEGMNEETLASIFRPYFTTKGKGTGLGMPIVKQIIDDHGALIEIQSEKGMGTCVRLHFK